MTDQYQVDGDELDDADNTTMVSQILNTAESADNASAASAASPVFATPCAPPAETAWEVLHCSAYEYANKHSWLRKRLESRMPQHAAAIGFTFRSIRRTAQFIRDKPAAGLAVAAVAGASVAYVSQAVGTASLLYLSLPKIVINNHAAPVMSSAPCARCAAAHEKDMM
jgi:hypothetical protein